MNNARRKRIEKIKDQLDALRGEVEEVQQEERDFFDSMPENMQGGERGQSAEAAADALQEAADRLDEAIGDLDTAIE